MLTLYGNPASRANRVRWLLLECQAPFREREVEFGPGGTRSPEFLALNPNGHIPVLVDGDEVIVESVAICLYVARRYGGPLFPADWGQAARAYQWPIWALSELDRPLESAGAHHSWLPAAQRSAQQASAARAKLAHPLQILQNELEERPYLAGPTFSVADIVVAEMMTASKAAGLDLGEFPAIRRWLVKCLSRPAARLALPEDALSDVVGQGAPAPVS
ncbi:MAG TPA: glutathione S-transferase family protein [Allosphingosinicella sp.]|nr:glutathione S-transferase family protein [Allosphingosinicella sp.]